MTCIVGLIDNGKVYIGGDSAGIGGYSLTVRADQKVFRNGDMIMGFTTSFRMGQLLRYSFIPPSIEDTQDVYKYMVTTFIDAVRECFIAGGYARKENEEESGGTFLVGFKSRLFSIQDDYQVGESIYPFHAIGCGADLALGSLYTSGKTLCPEDPTVRIEVALEAATEFNAGVRPNFNILML